MSETEYQRTLGYAKLAVDLLKRAQIPLYPQFYELFYTYATGVNAALNTRINAIFKNGDPSIDMAEAVYNDFIRAQHVSDQLSSVSEVMSSRIAEVHEAIDAALAGAKAYSSVLRAADGDLQGASEAERLHQVTLHLLKQTQQMQDTNHRLQQKLDASRDDIANLQRNLDQVRRESMMDPLTKVFNRRSFDEGLDRLIEEAHGSGQPLALMFIDIDHFKTFNDNYGHQTGDQVLRLVAMTIKSHLKEKDLVGRYGGEEFAIILPAVELRGALILADNIRRAILSKELLKRSTQEKLGRVTASFGVALYRVGESASALIERVDRCMYAAKHAGRNRVLGENELRSQPGEAAA